MNFRFSLFCLLLLAAGCRGPQAAFRFAPAPAQATVAATSVSADAPTEPVAATPAARQTAGVYQPKRPLPKAPHHGRRAVAIRVPRLRTAVPEAAAHRSARARSRPSQPQQPQLEHTGAFVLGVALVAGGVVAGLLLGGWLGLGVGALVVLGGYYFVGVGLGGKHAWLEVFQEFFNM